MKNCPKTVTVFVDEEAEEYLRMKDIEIRYLLESANLNFSSQGVDVRYDVKSLKVKKWNYKFEDLRYRKNYHEIRMSLEELRDAEYEAAVDGSEIYIFLSGRMPIGNGSVRELGWKFLVFGNRGKGAILVGAGMPDSEESPDRGSDLVTLASVIAHEQCHLYGLAHVQAAGSLMYPQSSYGKAKVLDLHSKRKLQKILINEKKCPAR